MSRLFGFGIEGIRKMHRKGFNAQEKVFGGNDGIFFWLR